MKHYKEFSKVNIGASDGATLTVRTPSEAFLLGFGEDGNYNAYLVEGEAEIGEHYTPVIDCEACWVRIYDDFGLAWESKHGFARLTIYRSGNFGCIIQCR